MKVYISSTYTDLQEYRAAVATVLRRMGHQVIGMEEYVSESMRPLERCLADVMACETYVGILAWRYGYVPPDQGGKTIICPKGATLGKTSITEFEFRQAVQCGRDVLMFLIDPEAEWPSTRFDALTGDREHAQAISELRQEIGQTYLVNYFRTPGELAGMVSAAVYRVEMSRQLRLESLNIQTQVPAPFVQGDPVRDTTVMDIMSVIGGPQELQGLQINIGKGRRWWTTRLYFFAVDMSSMEVMVFVDDEERFLGMANSQIVKESLARDYEVLRQYEEALARSGPPVPDLEGEVNRRASLWESQMQTMGGEHTKRVFVTKRQLNRWLGPYWITQAIDQQPGDSPILRVQRLIDWPLRFVPLLDQGRLSGVVDKQALMEQIARMFIREQVSRALSTTR